MAVVPGVIIVIYCNATMVGGRGRERERGGRGEEERERERGG